MTDAELRKLNRKDLLELLVDRTRELQAVQAKLAETEAALHSREIRLEQAGSIAEASLQLNGVFEAAQAACQQYIDSVTQLAQRQEQTCAQRDEESRTKAQALLAETEARCAARERETEARCAELTAKAEAEARSYWDLVSQKLYAFVEEHDALRQLLATLKDQTAGNDAHGSNEQTDA